MLELAVPNDLATAASLVYAKLALIVRIAADANRRARLRVTVALLQCYRCVAYY